MDTALKIMEVVAVSLITLALLLSCVRHPAETILCEGREGTQANAEAEADSDADSGGKADQAAEQAVDQAAESPPSYRECLGPKMHPLYSDCPDERWRGDT